VTDRLKPPAYDPHLLPVRTTSSYPKAFRSAVEGRSKTKLGDPCGLTDFGVNLTVLEPGAATALRHWHSHEDEFVMVLQGAPTLITNDGEQALSAGDYAAFPKNSGDGHCLVNRTDQPVRLLEVGGRNGFDRAVYPDLDLEVERRMTFIHRNGDVWED
jgi:uncharacterized cupin superfamily protein